MIERVTNRPPFGIEIRFDRSEIDNICLDELKTAKALPGTPGPIDIEGFIASRVCRDYGYEDLPDGIMGLTAFEANGRVKMVRISNKIEDGSRSAEHRARSTWAHEAGHCLLHPTLFIRARESSNASFWTKSNENVTSDRRFLCREQDFSNTGATCRYDGRWWEWQANRCIGGFLLPKALVLIALTEFLKKSPVTQIPELPNLNRASAESAVSKIFNVSMAVARIRLSEFFPPNADVQMSF